MQLPYDPTILYFYIFLSTELYKLWVEDVTQVWNTYDSEAMANGLAFWPESRK